jgi:hypothetical protein
MTRRAAVLALGVALLASSTTHAWESSAKWMAHVVGYRVNPKNNDVGSAEALAAIRLGADAWTKQTQAAFRFRYDGPSTATTQGLDGKNLVLFRNQSGSSPTVRASTYTWKLAGVILETDIVFWDKTMSYVTGSMPCNNQIYIENTAIHELGHALGLDHTDVSTATMWPKSKVCSKNRLKLDPDDIAGVEALYPCSSASQCNDADPCTKDSCSKKKCQRKPIAGCCTESADCDDGDPCTKDACKGNTCANTPIAGCCKTPPCDAGAPDTAAPTPDPDAGPPDPDAGTPDPDGAATSADGQASADAGGGSADARDPPSTSGGCEVGPGRGGGWAAAAAALLLGLCWRRRRRGRQNTHRSGVRAPALSPRSPPPPSPPPRRPPATR